MTRLRSGWTGHPSRGPRSTSRRVRQGRGELAERPALWARAIYRFFRKSRIGMNRTGPQPGFQHGCWRMTEVAAEVPTEVAAQETRTRRAFPCAPSSARKENSRAHPADPLEHTWTLWFDNPNGRQKQTSYGATLRPVYTFSSVEDFWWCAAPLFTRACAHRLQPAQPRVPRATLGGHRSPPPRLLSTLGRLPPSHLGGQAGARAWSARLQWTSVSDAALSSPAACTTTSSHPAS